MAKQEYEQAMEDQYELYSSFGTTEFVTHVGRYAKNLYIEHDTAGMALHPEVDRYTSPNDVALGVTIEGQQHIRTLLGRREDVLGREISSRWRSSVAEAECVYVTGGMQSLILDRLNKNNLTKIVSIQELLSPSGFVRFSSPYVAPTWDDEPDYIDGYPISAMVWLPHPQDRANRILTLWFIDMSTPSGRRSMVQQTRWAFERRNGREPTEAELQYEYERAIDAVPRKFVLDTVASMRFGSEHEAALRAPANQMFCMLMMTLMEPIGRIAGVPPQTPFVKKMAKKVSTGDINVLYLRKEVTRNPELRSWVEGRSQPYRHRVRSHWRRYWVTQPDGTKAQEWRKVSEHYRGSGPTVNTDNVYVLKR